MKLKGSTPKKVQGWPLLLIALSSFLMGAATTWTFSWTHQQLNDVVEIRKDDFSPATSNKGPLCKSFFSIMSVSYLPFDQEDDSACKRFYEGRYLPLLERQSAHMTKLNSTLTFFTSWTERQQQSPLCKFNQSDFPGLVEARLDPKALLRKFHFSEQQIRWIQTWHSTNPNREKYFVYKRYVAARLSDLWRLLLAREHGMAYIDLDMFPVGSDSSVFLGSPNVAVPIWAQENGALEIQNSGFCFTNDQLDLLIERIRNTIQSKGEEQSYPIYTEIGPVLFTRSIQALSAMAPTRFLFTTCNRENGPAKVLGKVAHYNNEIHWFHLDSLFRGSQIKNDISNLRNAFDQVFEGARPKEPPIPQYTWSQKTE